MSGMSEILESLASLPAGEGPGQPLLPHVWLWGPPAALLVLGLALWLWTSWRRRAAARVGAAIPPVPSPAPGAEWWRQEIERLRARGARSEQECREACFRLSQIVRRRLDEVGGRRARSGTADELAGRIDAGNAKLLRLLRAAKYDRRGPQPKSLDGYCDLALAAAAVARAEPVARGAPRASGRRRAPSVSSHGTVERR